MNKERNFIDYLDEKIGVGLRRTLFVFISIYGIVGIFYTLTTKELFFIGSFTSVFKLLGFIFIYNLCLSGFLPNLKSIKAIQVLYSIYMGLDSYLYFYTFKNTDFIISLAHIGLLLAGLSGIIFYSYYYVSKLVNKLEH